MQSTLKSIPSSEISPESPNIREIDFIDGMVIHLTPGIFLLLGPFLLLGAARLFALNQVNQQLQTWVAASTLALYLLLLALVGFCHLTGIEIGFGVTADG